MQTKVKLTFAEGVNPDLGAIAQKYDGVTFASAIDELVAQVQTTPALMANPRGTEALTEAAEQEAVLRRELGDTLSGQFTLTAPDLKAAENALAEIIDTHQEKVGFKGPADLTI